MKNPIMRLLRWNAIQYGLVAKSEYDIVYGWYEEKRDMCEDLQARIKKRDALITKLADDLQAANDSIEKMSIEIDTLQKRLARRKPRETGAMSK